ncbi:hypothetical protein [Flavobacterium wongokense]|uniref:hypothetical protein n=1 Tax=Flavobacterium wongokense TaxID=2910674 RepID=UPI001F32FB88|nr:hypothetical protein [Flavobacterium sp. WG47]MCF6131934.1 hypothetical protein [Flavobacterium sp. WG47]
MAAAEELSFVDQLSKNMEAMGKSLNRSYRYIFGISILIIFLSLGIIKPTKSIDFEWINLTLNLSPMLIILSSFLPLIMMNCYCLLIESSILGGKIKGIYKSYNLNIPDFKDDDYEYLTYPDLLDISLSKNLLGNAKIGKFIYWSLVIIVLLLLITLPIIAQILSLCNVHVIYDNAWWLWSIYLVQFLLDFIIISMIMQRLLE